VGRRIVVVGTTGSGKSTVAHALARAGGLTYLELDAFNWRPGWVESDLVEFRAGLTDALAGADTGWVVDGNYLTKTEDLTWPSADTVVFVDPSLALILVRIVRRTIRRARAKEELWSGNREQIRLLFTRDSLIVWALRTHRKNRRRYCARMRDPEWAHVRFVHLTTVKSVRAFLAEHAEG